MVTFKKIQPYDYLIIGSGIVGANIARELSKYQLRVLIVEKESDVVNGQTLANSGIIHSGHDPKAGTLKAKLCVEGNHLTHQLATELDFHLRTCGGMVLAFSEEEKEDLLALYDNAKQNGVEGLKLLSPRDIIKREPYVNDTLVMGLDLPTTSVCSPWEMALASLENAVLNGVKYRLNAPVTAIKKMGDVFAVEIAGSMNVPTFNVINASGIHSEEIGRLLDDDLPFHILPRKGEYFTLDPKNAGQFKHVLYPMPTSIGKGVLITPQVHGETLIGPTGEDVDQDDRSVSVSGLASIVEQALKTSKYIQFNDNIRNFAGTRAKSSYGDFYIQESKKYPGLYHLAGIDSPGLTAAPAIAKYLVELIQQRQPLRLKDHYIKGRQYRPLFRYLDEAQKQVAINNNAQYGKIVCKCENITAADITHALTGIIPAHTIKAVKKRTRAGAGICQGGYCERRVLKMIADYQDIAPTQVDYYEKDTPILKVDIGESSCE